MNSTVAKEKQNQDKPKPKFGQNHSFSHLMAHSDMLDIKKYTIDLGNSKSDMLCRKSLHLRYKANQNHNRAIPNPKLKSKQVGL